MARIQVLELPAEVVGSFVQTPFVLVVDQVFGDAVEVERLASALEQVRTQTGATAVVVTPYRLDVTYPGSDHLPDRDPDVPGPGPGPATPDPLDPGRGPLPGPTVPDPDPVPALTHPAPRT